MCRRRFLTSSGSSVTLISGCGSRSVSTTSEPDASTNPEPPTTPSPTRSANEPTVSPEPTGCDRVWQPDVRWDHTVSTSLRNTALVDGTLVLWASDGTGGTLQGIAANTGTPR